MQERSKAEIAAAVQARMDELRLTPMALVELAGVDKNTVRDFLTAKRRLQADNQLRFDDALQWAPGSLRRMYLGEAPTVVEQASAAPDPLQTLTDDELLAEIRRRMEGARHVLETTTQSSASTQGEAQEVLDDPEEEFPFIPDADPPTAATAFGTP